MRSQLYREAKALSAPILLYWVTVGLSLLMFCSAVLYGGTLTPHNSIPVIGMVLSAAIGTVIGQVFSLSRIRSSLFLTLNMGLFLFAVLNIQGIEGYLRPLVGRDAALFLSISMLFGSLLSTGGFWSLRVNRGLAAGWAPFVLFTGSILLFAQNAGLHQTWREGNKYAIWQLSTVLILLTAVGAQVLYLAARERHRLHCWATSPEAAKNVTPRTDPFRPWSGFGTLLTLGTLILFLTLSSALVSPYLWRTGSSNSTSSEIKEDPDGDNQPTNLPNLSGMKKLKRILQQGAGVACSLLTMVVLAFIMLIVFGLPARRQILLTHLRSPLWPVPPSRQAYLHWRLAEISLGDAGIHRQPGETAMDAAQRAHHKFPKINLEALRTAAEIADRVAYGYGLHATDVDTIRRAAEMTYQAIWDSLSEIERLKATYRPL